jgi:hypothetical protein
VQKNPNAEWNCNKISEILPFLKKVMPRIGSKGQSLFGLSFICLDVKPEKEDERKIIEYGLEPLLKAEIITKEEAEEIIQWFLKTKPTWDSNHESDFKKEFEIDGKKYTISTDSIRNYRDLNLLPSH